MASQQKPPSSGNGKLIGGILAILLAIICFIIATNVYPQSDNSNVSVDPNAVVTCNGQTMNPGDTCVHTLTSSTYGSGSYNDDYQQQAIYQQAETQKNIADVVGGVGIPLLLGGIVVLLQYNQERRRIPRPR
jgi:hypothetical protein